MMSYTKTISQALYHGAELLLATTDKPRLESEMLLANVLHCSRVYLLAHPENAISEQQAHQYATDVQRRVNGEPLPYITGKIEFYGMLFEITPDVLIPRPETEMLVELASDWLATHPDAVVLDVGTGSGCIALSIAKYTQCRQLFATDISMAALRVAQQNALKHGVSDRVRFTNCDLLLPIRGPVDVIISNPPYIADHTYAELPHSIHHEPPIALLAGVDGLQVVRRLLDQARCVLHSHGLMLIEIGAQQGDAVSALAEAAFPNASIQVLGDLAGLDRVIRIQCFTRTFD